MPDRRPCDGAAFCAGTGGLAKDAASRPKLLAPKRLAVARTAKPHARAKALVLRRDPFQRGFRQLVKKPALDVVAGLAVQHARLRMAQVQALARAGDGHVHQAALFLQALVVVHRVFMREQALFHAGDEHAVKLQALGRMHRHELDGVLPGLRLVVARFQRRMRQERRQRLRVSPVSGATKSGAGAFGSRPWLTGD
jgi:hypothetical protein